MTKTESRKSQRTEGMMGRDSDVGFSDKLILKVVCHLACVLRRSAAQSSSNIVNYSSADRPWRALMKSV